MTHQSRIPAGPIVAAFGALVLTLAGCGSLTEEEGWTPGTADGDRSASKTTSPLTVGAARSAPGFSALLDKARQQGTARVIVQLNTSVALEATLASDQVADQRQRIKAHQASLLARLAPRKLKRLSQFEYSPLVELEADADTLEMLADLPDVVQVHENKRHPPLLAQSVPMINAPQLIAAGDDGAGQTVAILDSGVDPNHPDLAGKVVSEACYSDNLCPGGATSSTAPGSGANCTSAQDCWHGTMVSGVAAGRQGVAPRANIISIQVFSLQTGTACDPKTTDPTITCISSSDSDFIHGLERVYALRNTFSIAAANLSLGSGWYDTPCDGALAKDIIDNLRAAGIATVAAAGNSAYDSTGTSFLSGLARPACISSAVSVGSVGDGSGGTYLDRISSWSQTASYLSLLAPGEAIDVPIPGGGYYAGASGTSLAAPHVTGAFAVMKSRRRDLSVTAIETALQSNSAIATDFRYTAYTPRIDLGTVAGAAPNLALGGAVTSSGSTCSPSEGPSNAVNGQGYDKWCAFGANQWIRVDLGGLRRLRAFTIKHAEAGGEDPSYNSRDFNIEVSRDGSTWTRPLTVTGNTAPITTHTLGSPYVARYVRLNVVTPGTNGLAAARIYEFQVWGEPGTNLALNKATSSSQTCSPNETGSKAVNGSSNTTSDKWCSNVTSRWLRVDLGDNALIDRIVVKHAGSNKQEVSGYNTSDYDLSVSLDGSNWTVVSSVRGNTSNLRASLFTPTTARYVRLDVLNGGIDNVARIYELEVYGTANQARGKTASGTTNCASTQSPDRAVDGSAATTNNKWCSVLGTPSQYWWKVDFGGNRTLTWLTLRHAGVLESASLNTKNFTIQTSTDNVNWTTAATVTNNTSSITNHQMNPTSARYLRVNITAPTSSSDTRARLYEVEAY